MMWVLAMPFALCEHALLAVNKLPSYGIYYSAETPPQTCVPVFKVRHFRFVMCGWKLNFIYRLTLYYVSWLSDYSSQLHSKLFKCSPWGLLFDCTLIFYVVSICISLMNSKNHLCMRLKCVQKVHTVVEDLRSRCQSQAWAVFHLRLVG